MKILIIDRIKLFQRMIAHELDKTDIMYYFCSSGEEVLSSLKDEVFDMICLPLFLDDMDGLVLCSHIRKNPNYQFIPIVLMTADNTPEVMKEALDAGVTDIFDKKNLKSLINFIIHGYQQNREVSGKILYVEDSRSQRLLVHNMLTYYGLSVDAFESADEAWEVYQQQHYDLVITDIVLEGSMSGITLANHIRCLEGQKGNVQLLVLTAFDNNSSRIGLFSLGINNYLTKPIIEKELIATVRVMLERQQLLDELNVAKQRAEKADNAKSQFLAGMSHELRTPLHGILSFARFGIQNSIAKPEKLLKYFKRIDNSAERLLLLLDDLLDLSMLEAGKMTLDRKQSDLNLIIKQVISEQQNYLDDKEIQLVLEAPQVETKAYFDSLRIAQVVTNLVSNAIKFTISQQTIYINFAAAQLMIDNKSVPALRFNIFNEGDNLAKVELDAIFIKFVQSKTNYQAGKGTGLGLAICKEIIQAHQGKIWAENKQGGICFSVVLPCVVTDEA